MAHGSDDTVAFRLWPPVAVGAPLLVGWLATLLWGDPVDLGGWRVPLGWALVLLFVAWNGWSLWLFGRHETGLLPGQATNVMIEQGPYRLSRNPLYVGLLALYLGLALLAPTFWGLVLFPAAVLLVLWGAIRPRNDSCTSGSGRRTTTTRGGCAAGFDGTAGVRTGFRPQLRATRERCSSAASRCTLSGRPSHALRHRRARRRPQSHRGAPWSRRTAHR